jgi:cell division septation protein DedD
MEQRLKERLTGAAILVAVIVLIVPELFHGHLAERAGKSANSSEGPPMRSYLIDLGASHSAPLQLGAASARGLAASPAVSAAPGAASEAAGAPIAPAPTPAPLASSAPVASAQSALPASGHPPAKAPASSRSGGTRAKAAVDWSVQLGLYAKRANAEHMVHVAHTKGFPASVTAPDAKGRYRVRVAGLTTRSAALTLAARLRAAGLPAAAVGPR